MPLVTGLLLASCMAKAADAQSIIRIAGGGTDDGRPATVATATYPYGVAVDSTGDVYFASFGDNVIRRVSRRSGLVHTIAGNGSQSYTGDGGAALGAGIKSPDGVAVDPAGNVFVSDSNDVIRRIDAETGVITTYAGLGFVAPFVDGALATECPILNTGVATDPAGNVYIAIYDAVARVDRETGIIRRVAGWGHPPDGVGDGLPATEANLGIVGGMAIDASGHLYIGDHGSLTVRVVDAETGIIRKLVGGGSPADGVGDGLPASEVAIQSPQLGGRLAVGLSPSGELFFVSRDRVRRLTAAGTVETIAGGGAPEDGVGDGLPGPDAALETPNGLAFDRDGNLFISDASGNRIRMVSPSGVISTFAGTGIEGFLGDGSIATAAPIFQPHDVALDEKGNLYIADQHIWGGLRYVNLSTGVIDSIEFTSSSSGRASPMAKEISVSGPTEFFGGPTGLAVDLDGTVLMSEPLSNRIRRLDPITGKLTLVAGTGDRGFSGDGGPATLAQVSGPYGIDVSPSGEIVFADSGNHRIRAIDRNGIVRTIAGNGESTVSGDGGPATTAGVRVTDVVCDADGNVYAAGSGYVRRVDASGVITGIGGAPPGEGSDEDGIPATTARLWGPVGIEVDPQGGVLITESDWFVKVGRVRRIDPETGLIETIAGGSNRFGFYGDGGAATSAALTLSGTFAGLAVNADGDVYVADKVNSVIRLIPRCGPADIPLLGSPADASSGLRDDLSLRWQPSRRAVRYDVYLDTVSPPQKLVARDVESAALSLSDLMGTTTYYWRVVAKGDPYCDPVSRAQSEVRSFTTTESCAPPVPANGVP